MEISDLFYLSYLLPASRLVSHIPKPLAPSFFVDGRVFLSVVGFHSTNVRIAGLPGIRFAYDQVNVRTYVREPLRGETGVLFLLSGINSSFISRATNMLGFPWQNIPFALETIENRVGRPDELHAEGKWNGNIKIKIAKEFGSGLSESLTDVSRHITSPRLGFYNVGGSALGFRVNHTEVRPGLGKALCVDFPLLNLSGFLTDREISKPDNVLVADGAIFTIFLPPQKMKEREE